MTTEEETMDRVLLAAELDRARAERDDARAAIRRAQKAIRDGAVSAGAVALALVGVGDTNQPSTLDERDAARAERDLLAAELGRVQEAYDRAKPVLDAAERLVGILDASPSVKEVNLGTAGIYQAVIRYRAAVDAYDTAQKAPETAPESTLSHEPAEVDRRYEDAAQKAPEQ